MSQNNDKQKNDYQEKCQHAKYYPFSLHMNDKTLELVCADHIQFKYVTDGFSELIRFKASLSKMAKRVKKDEWRKI